VAEDVVRRRFAASRRNLAKVKSHFDAKDWLLWDHASLKTQLASLSKSGYENMVAAVVSKLLLR
jgi:predicted ABC-type ATPase